MAKPVIAYDKDLPEIPDRWPWEKPTQHLVKDESTPNSTPFNNLWQNKEGESVEISCNVEKQ